MPRHVWVRIYADGRFMLRSATVAVRRTRLDIQPQLWEGMGDADIWRIINVGV